jgi:hypothetical protein
MFRWPVAHLLQQLLSCAGGGAEHGHRVNRLPVEAPSGRLKLLKYKSLGAGLTDRKPDACASLCPERAESRSAPDLPVPSLLKLRPFPWVEFSVLGNAKLLPQVVHVKRETLQVVSLAMTGLVPDWSQDFHKNASFSSQFSVLSSQFSGLAACE